MLPAILAIVASRPHLFVVSTGGKWTSAGGLVFDRKGRVALVRERRRSGERRWTLPKGKLEPGETLQQAALREVHEETGVRARITGYVDVHEGKRSFVHYFRMTVVRVESPLDVRVEEVRFVAPARAAELLRSARDRRILRGTRPAPLRRARRLGRG
jgi:8-oxo-dGTP pyrophosphatase MutT (NUDIX family)